MIRERLLNMCIAEEGLQRGTRAGCGMKQRWRSFKLHSMAPLAPTVRQGRGRLHFRHTA